MKNQQLACALTPAPAVMLMLFSILVWLGAYKWGLRSARLQGHSATPMREYMTPRLVVTFVSIVFLVYPDVTEQLLSLFSCQLLDDNSLSRPYYLNLMRPGR
jgi:hypothetical protein